MTKKIQLKLWAAGFIAITFALNASAQDQMRDLETELNQAYQTAIGKLSESQKDQLKADERNWIKQRDASEAKSKDPQGTHLRLTKERLVFLKSLSKKQNNKELEDKEFYGPSDRFPKNKIGIKIVGHFTGGYSEIVNRFYLDVDKSKGEKEIMRRFYINNPIKKGCYEFTKENPLIVTADEAMGNYTVKFIEAPNKQNIQLSSEKYKVSIKDTDPSMNWLVEQTLDDHKTSEAEKRFKNQIEPLSGYMNIPWGTEFKDVALGGRLSFNELKCLKNYALLYEQNLQSTNSPLVRMQKLIDLDNEQNDIIKSKGMSEYPILPEYGEISFANNSNNQYINYHFCNSRLYAVDIGGFEINKSNAIDTNNFYNSLEEQTEVYTRAFVHKYGNPKLELKKSTLPVIGEVNYITETWSNNYGTVVMVLISHKLEADIGRFLLDLGKSYVGNKINESLIGGTTAADSIKSTLDSLSDTAEDKLKDLEKMFTLSHITYYSKKYMDSSADYLDKFEQKRTKDIEDYKRTRDNEMNAKANKIMDKI
jgi:hypothetical protein